MSISSGQGDYFLQTQEKISLAPENFPFQALECTFQGLKRTFQGLKRTFKGLERKINLGGNTFFLRSGRIFP